MFPPVSREIRNVIFWAGRAGLGVSGLVSDGDSAVLTSDLWKTAGLGGGEGGGT